MHPVVTAEQMRKIDALVVRRHGIPSSSLMERAGRGVIENAERHLGSLRGKNILFVCGKGNNGGDGFVAARYALEREASVSVYCAEDESVMQGDALENYRRLKELAPGFCSQLPSREKFDVIVDALFGTSFHGKLEGRQRKIVEWINAKGCRVVAVDVPSGMDATTGEVLTSAVKADLTVTMAAPKLGMFLGHGWAQTGKIAVADIGIPMSMILKESKGIFLTDESDVRDSLPRRPIGAHKHSVGKIFFLAGSRGLTGAALLSSLSAMRSGAGAVVLGVPEAVFSTIARRTLEVMPTGLPSTPEGTLGPEAFEAAQEKIQWCDVLVLGPGLSLHQQTQRLIHEIVSKVRKPMVVDADGLNALSHNMAVLKGRRERRVILTPHMGEFSRMVRIPAHGIEKEKIAIARSFSRRHRLVLLLKGAPTFIADPIGRLYINPTGNPGMATAGSGDVLTGIIAAMLGQGNSLLHAAINGAFVHGMAGDFARDDLGEMAMIARDILRRVPRALRFLVEGHSLS